MNLLALLASVLVGCASAPDTTGPSTADTTTADTGTESPGTGVPLRPEGVDPLDDLAGLAGLSCAQQRQCAPGGSPLLGSTCCTFGDPLVSVWQDDQVIEGTDIELRGGVVALCQGVGAYFGTLSDDGSIVDASQPADIPRCQRAAIGERREDGSRDIYLAHHGGDTILETPTLFHVRRASNGDVEVRGRLTEPGVMYEGLALVRDHLWVAAHGGGLRSYAIGSDGAPTLVRTVGGFDNALKIAVNGAQAYVTDTRSVHLFDATSPGLPVRVGTVPLAALPRDIVADDEHVMVALGSAGLQVLRPEGGTWIAEPPLEVDGSVQAVAMGADHVALAAWDHVALLERDGLDRLGGIKLEDSFEQTWALALDVDTIVGVEFWGIETIRIRPGHVAPELAADAELLAFDEAERGERAFFLHNRGPLGAMLGEGTVGGEVEATGAFTVTFDAPRLAPGARTLARVAFVPPVAPGDVDLSVWSNDPSPRESPLRVPMSTFSLAGLDVGDTLTEDFAFLDPTGAGSLDNLRGHVTVLAYFALF